MRVANIPIFPTAADLSTSNTSAAFSVFEIYGWSAQLVFTGSPVGTLSVEVSCDPGSPTVGSSPASAAPTNWTTLADSSTAITTATTVVYNVNLSFYNWIRFVYTRTSGTGGLTGKLNVKGA